MGFRIQNNMTAINALRNLGVSDSAMATSLGRLSSGYRINSAKDDAAGLAISQTFRGNIASVKVAQRNITEANSLLQVAEGAMSSIGDILTRMKELATQAASANVGTDISKIKDEYDALYDEVDRIANSTKYAGTKLTDGSFSAGNTSTTWSSVANIYDVAVTNATTGSYTVAFTSTGNALTITDKNGHAETETLADAGGTGGTVNFAELGISFKYTGAMVATTLGAALDTANLSVSAGSTAAFQIGYETDTNSRIGVSLANVTASGLSLAAKASITDAASARTALDKVTAAINTVSTARANIGAYQNRLTYAGSNLSITLENFTAAESTIRDVDMAAEMTTFTKSQIMLQAGTAMLAQANQAPQQLLSLFQ